MGKIVEKGFFWCGCLRIKEKMYFCYKTKM